MKILLALAAFLLAATAANAQSALPSAQPYTTSATTVTVTTAIPTYTVSYTYTLSSTAAIPNPRQQALNETFKLALGDVLTALGASQQQQATFAKANPATFVSSYRILSERYTPAYTLQTEMTFSEPLLKKALYRNTPVIVPAVASETSPTADAYINGAWVAASSTVTLILGHPTASDLARLEQWAQTAHVPAAWQRLSRGEATFVVQSTDPNAVTTALTSAGYSPESDPTAPTPTYRLQ